MQIRQGSKFFRGANQELRQIKILFIKNLAKDWLPASVQLITAWAEHAADKQTGDRWEPQARWSNEAEADAESDQTRQEDLRQLGGYGFSVLEDFFEMENGKVKASSFEQLQAVISASVISAIT